VQGVVSSNPTVPTNKINDLGAKAPRSFLLIGF
jgi:hypothetical protein